MRQTARNFHTLGERCLRPRIRKDAKWYPLRGCCEDLERCKVKTVMMLNTFLWVPRTHRTVVCLLWSSCPWAVPGRTSGQLKDKSFIKTSSNSMVKLKKSLQTNITGNTSKVLNLFKVHSFSREQIPRCPSVFQFSAIVVVGRGQCRLTVTTCVY